MDEAIPNHIGLILDGNRRWAKAHGLPTLKGHQKGYETLRTVLDHALERGIRYVSVFSFSTENWNRSKEEVGYLMDLMLWALGKELKQLNKKGVRIVWLGSEDRVSQKLRKALRNAEEQTVNNTRGTLGICFNYGGQREIVEAVQRLMQAGAAPGDVSEELIAQHLYGPDIPPIDLLIRTSGEQRISNFMLWRAAYSELKFIDKPWPDFTPADLDEAIEEYGVRNRRFGG